jgi:hypothetical protein
MNEIGALHGCRADANERRGVSGFPTLISHTDR